MASIIFTMTTGQLAVVEFDATMTENHNQTAAPTEHPVEVGANVSDHVRPELAKVTIVGVITNSPINETWSQPEMYQVGAVLGEQRPFTLTSQTSRQVSTARVSGGYPRQLPGGLRVPFVNLGYVEPEVTPGRRENVTVSTGGTAWAVAIETDRVRLCFDELMGMCERGEVVTLLTSIREYPEMVITSVNAPVDGKNAITFTIELTSIRFAETKSVAVRRRKPKEKKAEEVKSEGYKPTYIPPENENAGLESHLHAAKAWTLKQASVVQ